MINHLTIWLATRRANKQHGKAVTIRRDLRDTIRTESDTARAHEIRARGLRLYAAWLRPRAATPAAQGLAALIPGAEPISTYPAIWKSTYKPVRTEVA